MTVLKINKEPVREWFHVASLIASMLDMLEEKISLLENPDSRFVMKIDWSVYFTNDTIDRTQPAKLLGEDDAAAVFVFEEREAFLKWFEAIQGDSDLFKQIEADQFAKVLTRKLQDRTNKAK